MIEMETQLWEIEGKLAPRLNHTRQSCFSFLCDLWPNKPAIVDTVRSQLVLIYFSVFQVTGFIPSRFELHEQNGWLLVVVVVIPQVCFLMGSAFGLHMIGE